MKKKLLLFFVTLLILPILVSGSTGLAKISGFLQNATAMPTTGAFVIEQEPNDVQKVYVKSAPAVVKIVVYLDFERYLPAIENIDWYEYSRKYNRGLQPTMEDVVFAYDANTNYYDLLEEEYGEDYGANVEDFPFSTGSGFIIHPDGYVLTNAHVIAARPGDVKEVLRNYYMNTFYYAVEESYANDPQYTSDMYWDDMAILHFMDKSLEIRDLEIKTEVVVGVDKKSEQLSEKDYAPTLLDYELGKFDPINGTFDYRVLDWALLKIEGKNFPTLPLGDSDKLSTGSQVISVGYPFVSEDVSDELSYEYKTNVEPTLTTGYISQTTKIARNNYFQVDVAISEGNSGGPALDQNGNVIGISTYGLQYYIGGNYNYLLRINDIKAKIADKVAPAQGQADNLWAQGLENYWNGDYAESKANFENLISLSPSYPYAKRVLSEVSSKEPLQKPGVVQLEGIDISKWGGLSFGTILVSGIGLVIIVLLVVLIVRQEGTKKKK